MFPPWVDLGAPLAERGSGWDGGGGGQAVCLHMPSLVPAAWPGQGTVGPPSVLLMRVTQGWWQAQQSLGASGSGTDSRPSELGQVTAAPAPGHPAHRGDGEALGWRPGWLIPCAGC